MIATDKASLSASETVSLRSERRALTRRIACIFSFSLASVSCAVVQSDEDKLLESRISDYVFVGTTKECDGGIFECREIERFNADRSWSLTRASSVGGNWYVENGEVCINHQSGNPGDSRTICRSVKFDGATATMKRLGSDYELTYKYQKLNTGD